MNRVPYGQCGGIAAAYVPAGEIVTVVQCPRCDRIRCLRCGRPDVTGKAPSCRACGMRMPDLRAWLGRLRQWMDSPTWA